MGESENRIVRTVPEMSEAFVALAKSGKPSFLNLHMPIAEKS